MKAEIVVAAGGETDGVLGLTHDGGPQEHHQIGFFIALFAIAKQSAEQRNAAQDRHPLGVFCDLILDEPAQHHGMTVLHHHSSLQGTLIGNYIRRRGGDGPLHARHLLKDLQLDGAAFGDLRLNLKSDAYVLALDGLKRVHRSSGARCLSETAGHEGHVLSHDNLGLGVVQRQEVRRGKNIAVILLHQGPGQRA